MAWVYLSASRSVYAAATRCALLFVVTLPRLAAGDWPQFRGPGGGGVSAETGLPVQWSATENIAWKIELPGPGTSSPAIKGSRLFIASYSGFNVPGKPRGEPAQLRLHVTCLNVQDGKALWTSDVSPKLPEEEKIREGHGYASSTPAVDDDRVYVFFGKSGVFAFDHKGKQKWQADVGSKTSGWGSAASPVLYEKLVFINASVESESLVALDRETGAEKWRAPGIKESWNTPVLVTLDGGKNELVVAMIQKVLGFDPKSGEQRWSCRTDIPWYMVPSIVSHGGVSYVIGGRGSGGGLAVRGGGTGDVTKTHRVWTCPKGSNVPSPVYHDGHLYWIHDVLGIAFCADAKTGTLVYEKRMDGASDAYASAVLGDGKLYYVTRRGRTFVLAAKPEFELLATNELGDRSTFNASPAIAGGKLFLRSDRFLYCVGGK